MTALCGGGTSSARPGYARLLYVAPWVIAGLITDVPPAAAAAIGGAIGSSFYDLDQFCATDPPAMPTITVDDVADLFQPQALSTFGPARQKFQDWIGNLAWRHFCQCDAGTTPPAITTPTPVSQFNPTPSVGPAIQGSGACLDVTQYSLSQASGIAGPTFSCTSTTGTSRQIGSQFFSVPGPARSRAGYTGTFQTWALPSGPNTVQFSGHTYSGSPRTTNIILNIPFWNAAGSFLGAPAGNAVPFGNGIDWTLVSGTIPTGATHAAVTLEACPGDPDFSIDARLVLSGPNCNNAVQSPCCPPDPSLSQQIDRIYQLLQTVQRQHVPFAYIPGTVHAGLTGSGSFPVTGVLGARLEVTAISSASDQVAGDPTTLFGSGWINWGNADGVTPREWLAAAHLLSLPGAAGVMTRLHYSLPPGVTVTITELLAEH